MGISNNSNSKLCYALLCYTLEFSDDFLKCSGFLYTEFLILKKNIDCVQRSSRYRPPKML